MTPKPIDPKLLGCGVSLALPEHQMQPVTKVKKFADDLCSLITCFSILKTSKKTPILSPQDPLLNLREYSPNPDIIKRCGRFIYQFIDAKSGKLVCLIFSHSCSN